MTLPPRDERARRLAAIGRGLTYARSLDEMLEMTIDCAVDLMGANCVAVLLTDADGMLRVRAGRGISPGAAAAFGERLDEKLLDHLTDLFAAETREKFLGVPLVVEGGVIGLLALRRDNDPGNDDEEEWLLSTLADQAALAVESTHHRELRRELENRVGRLERERRDKDHALEILSHDLRSPLNAIQGYAALMSAEILGPVNERQQDALRKMRGISDHVTTILGNVLDMARLTSGSVELDVQSTTVASVVTGAIDILRPAAERAQIAIDVEGGADLEIETDPHRLRQVVTQLLDNAVKYSPDGTTVRVELRAFRGGVEIVVADQGRGIPHEMRERIFEPYVRADGDDARGHSGVGLGLALARVVIERLGGSLSLDENARTGATFRVRLPLRAPQ